jgi:peptidyl-prolyl cis-trans isomerase SurA
MGLRAADRYPELFVSAVARLPVGGVAGPVRSGAGFHVPADREKPRQPARHRGAKPRTPHPAAHSAQLSETAAVERLADYRRRILRARPTSPNWRASIRRTQRQAGR